MLSRRDLFVAGMAGGVAAGAAPVEAHAADEPTREGQREIARQIAGVERTLDAALLSNSIAHGFVPKLREQMQAFFRSHAKFPDYIDIGVAVFMDIYDWHIRHRQAVAVQRQGDGRYWLQFMFTTLILRPEVDPAYIGIPYDRA